MGLTTKVPNKKNVHSKIKSNKLIRMEFIKEYVLEGEYHSAYKQ